MEYDYAVEAGLPVLAFLHGDPGKIVAEKTEDTSDGKAALKNFRKKIESARHAKFWTSPKDLALAVFQSMSSLMKTTPRIGWVRADRVLDESAAQEILRLRKKIDELEAHIARTELTAPPGTDDFARGDSTVSLHFRYRAGGYGDFEDATEVFSWNEILSMLGPVLITEARESVLRDKFGEVFRNRFKDKFQAEVDNAYLARDEEFQRVKLQLKALGLIQTVGAAWTLTPYGDRMLTQVAAIRSSARA